MLALASIAATSCGEARSSQRLYEDSEVRLQVSLTRKTTPPKKKMCEPGEKTQTVGVNKRRSIVWAIRLGGLETGSGALTRQGKPAGSKR